MNTPIARVSFRRSSSDVRSRDAAAGGAGFALVAAGAAGGVDEVAGRGASDLGAPAAGVPASLPAFRGAMGGFVAPLLVDGDRLGVELALPEPGVVVDPDRSARAGEGVCADEGAVAPVPALPASDPCVGLCCSAGCGGADAGGLE